MGAVKDMEIKGHQHRLFILKEKTFPRKDAGIMSFDHTQSIKLCTAHEDCLVFLWEHLRCVACSPAADQLLAEH